jgi:quinoprotein glucose dehydrogenase
MRSQRPRVLSIVLALLAAGLLGGGATLVYEGGSWWYAVTGAVLAMSALLLWLGNRWGVWLYGLMVTYTFGWSLWEVGLNAWALLPRMLLLALLWLWVLAPCVQRQLDAGPRRLSRQPVFSKAYVLLVCAIALAAVIIAYVAIVRSSPTIANMAGPSADQDTASTDWSNYGNDKAGTRYSELTQIKPMNVSGLKLVWRFATGDMAQAGQDYNYEATPLKIGNLLYVCTPGGLVFALEATTGKQAWRFDGRRQNAVPHLVCRGVSYALIASGTAECAQRIYVTTPDIALWSLDALTGRPCQDFGDVGRVDLTTGLGSIRNGVYAVTSPPIVTKDRLVLGAEILDNISTDMPSGVVRAFDPMSGKLIWAWDMGRPDGTGPPRGAESYTRSTPNAWAPLAADEALGMVYAPTGNPSPDFWGKNRRPFDEHYGSSIVALDLKTGNVRWSFQTTHHDLWDNDLPAQPVLVDVTTKDGKVPAVIQGTKQGEIFVLDRRTGVPIVPVNELPVPQGSNIGEHLASTQPASGLSVKPAASRITERMMWGLTPLDQLWCRIQYREARYEGPYTPPDGRQTVLEYPAMFGGIEWGGLSVDPARQILVSNPNAMPFLVKMAQVATRTGADGLARPEMRSHDLRPIEGTGYALFYAPFMSPLQIPCLEPPWGLLYAIDLRTDRVIWQRPVGTAQDSGPLGFRSHLQFLVGTPQIGGTIITRSGLIFSSATADDYLRAYDIQDGSELWRARLPAGGQATPMTYVASGRQFVVVVAGGHGILGTRKGDYVLAYALN